MQILLPKLREMMRFTRSALVTVRFPRTDVSFTILALITMAGIVALVGVGCGKGMENVRPPSIIEVSTINGGEDVQSPRMPTTIEGPTTCAPAGGGRVPLADTGYTVELPSRWCLYEWTKDDPVFHKYPYMGKPEPFLLQSTHGIKNREWAVMYPKGNDIGVACELSYFVAPVDKAYLEWESKLPPKPGPEDMFGPGINIEYSTEYHVNASVYFERPQAFFENDATKYYDLFGMGIAVEEKECRQILFASLKQK